VDARAEVLEVGTHGRQSGFMLAGVELAPRQPALAHLVVVAGGLVERDDLIVVSGPATASVYPFMVMWRWF